MEVDLGNAIAEVIAAHEERGLVTKWIALIETLDGEGAPGLWTATSDGLSAWDTEGMLGHALTLQRCQTAGFMLGMLGGDD